MGEIIAARFNRRDMLRGSLAVTAISATLGKRALAADEQPAKKGLAPTFDFKEIEAGVDDKHHVRPATTRRSCSAGAIPSFPDAPDSIPRRRPPRSRPASSATIATIVGFHPDRRVERARPSRGQPRVHERGADVPGRRHAGPQGRRLRQDDEGPRRHRDDGPWRRGGRDRARRRQMARREGQPATTAASRRIRRWRSPGRRPATSA